MPSVIGLKREILYLQGRTQEFADGGGGLPGANSEILWNRRPLLQAGKTPYYNNYLANYEDFSCLERDCYLSYEKIIVIIKVTSNVY